MNLLLLKFEASIGDAVEHIVTLAVSYFVSTRHLSANTEDVAAKVPTLMLDCMLPDAD